MKCTQSRLADYFPAFISTGAIFSKMQGMPWDEYIDGETLDLVYFGSHSGIKFPAALVKLLSTDGVADSQKLADVLSKLYQKNWNRLWDAYVSEYSPITNYKIDEKVIRNLEASDTGLVETNQSTESEGENSGTRNDVVDETNATQHGHVISGTNDAARSEYGFNTTGGAPIPVASENGTNSTTNSGTDTVSRDADNTSTNSGQYSDSTSGSQTEEEERSRSEDEITTMERSGNIGYQSYQNLLRQEIELWKWNFFEQVFEDCDSVLCLKVF